MITSSLRRTLACSRVIEARIRFRVFSFFFFIFLTGIEGRDRKQQTGITSLQRVMEVLMKLLSGASRRTPLQLHVT